MERFWTKHYDEDVPADLTHDGRTVLDNLDQSVSRWPNQPACTLKGKTLSYRELKDQIDRFASALSKLGVKKDSRVSVWMPNLPQTIIASYATFKLGAQVVNTNPLYVEREIEHQYNDAGVSVVVTCDFLWMYRLKLMMSKVPTVKQVVVTSIPDYLPFPLNLLAPLKLKKTKQYVKVPREANVHYFKELIAQNQPWTAKPPITPDDVAVLQYTGGTTGVSKGAMLTHCNIAVNAQQCLAWFPRVELGREVLLACLPYFHSFGMTVSMNFPVLAGAHVVLTPNPRDIADLVNSITKYRVTLFPAVPALFLAINNYPDIDKTDISCVKFCFSGSAPLPLDVLERFEKLTGSKITEGFGLTETSPVSHVNPLFKVRKPGSVGIPMSGTDVKIVDIETGEKELGVNQEGELCIKGPQVMKGYWNRPDETAKMIKDGWCYTGDLAKMDDDGYTYIVGRKKEMILSGGYNVYPDEIDNVLFAHPAVLEAASIGVPDERRGESIKSFVVLKPGSQATVDEIMAFCKKELAAYKVPKAIEFLDALPKSTMMKILRRELKDRELAKMKTQPPKPAAEQQPSA
ncbi:MAG: long-chain fatty acid--CoA ligase [Deltaproteobacteria bacterium]|nr:long-chain fatty acid--CoA ligase [Deltaproteobacteria bacterium]